MNEGDEAALAVLYDGYAERLYDYVLSLSGDYKTAADIVHDTFIDACRRAPRMRHHSHLRPWLYGAARRRCVQRGRGRALFWEPDLDFGELPAFAGRPEEPSGTATGPGGRGRPGGTALRRRLQTPARPQRGGPDRRAAAPSAAGTREPSAMLEPPSSAELRRLLEAVLSRLDAGEQEALLLAVRHGLRPAEIGIVLGISARRAAARVARSRTELEEAFETELLLLTERCAARRRPQPAVDVADAEAELLARTETMDADAGGTGSAGTVVSEAAAKPPPHEPPAGETAPAGRPGPAPRRGNPSGRKRRTGQRTPAAPGDAPFADHRCDDCDRRAAVYPAALLALAPAPVLPAALRHRVVHTATDPELAGYRADIAARGGGLTPAGLPSQPDMPSPFTKRWLFAGGGMAGALVTALLGALLMGPGLGNPTIYWPPFQTRPQPSITEQGPTGKGKERDRRQPPQGRAPSGPAAAPSSGPGTQERRTPRPSPKVPVSPPPTGPGMLAVSPAKVELYGTKTGNIKLTAMRGPVAWNAVSSSEQISVSRPQGDLDRGATTDLTITLAPRLLNLPGEATVTFIDPTTGDERQITVVWDASLF
ncbi:RNA polymerase sigma factor [Actinomadura vinacea]|uniref:RNA polymerase sigma factor n=1 Tax=Actinomadura vinacea TaxID=115336 RepID=UPI0031D870CF